MRLIEGDAEEFGNILNLIDDYEGVLQRQESLAANLGAKLTAPLLLKSFEKLFEGPIKVSTPFGTDSSNITWLDVVDFARSKPQEFVLTESRNGGRICQFWLKQCSVEISEDDYRLIVSGAPERMIPTQPIAGDEIAELGTIDIVEGRLSMLIKRADLVAARARQLNYHLKGRRSAIASRQSTQHGSEHSQIGSPSAFGFTGNGGLAAPDKHSIHQDLLRQFIPDNRRTITSRSKTPHLHPESALSPNASASPLSSGQGRRVAANMATALDDGTGGQYRPMITARVEKLNRGEPIWPPCDRCRRLRMECTKYLTACGGCTKKHAKCTWRDITDDEIAYLVQMPEVTSETAETSTSAVDLNANLDPGLRPIHEATVTIARPKMDAQGGTGNGKRVDVSSDEHAILTHMATAAAAQSSR